MGENQTGVTTFKLKQEIDTGDILGSRSIDIGDEETAGELHDRMKEIGAELLLETLQDLSEGKSSAIAQENFQGEFKHAPKIFTSTAEIDWQQPVDRVYDLIRGLSPYPAAFTIFRDKKLKIFKAEKEFGPSPVPGEYRSDHKTELKFAARDGWISVKELQLEGKKKMTVEEFLRGYKF